MNSSFGMLTGNTPLSNAIETEIAFIENLSGVTGPTGPFGSVSITDTTNQISVSNPSPGLFVLSTPQNTNTGANIIFNSVSLNTSPNVLDYYETGNFDANISGAWSATWNIQFTRIGNSVTLIFPANDTPLKTTVVALGIFGTVNSIIPRLQPTSPVYGLLSGINNGINTTFSFVIGNDGTFYIGNSATDITANFTAGTNIATGPYSWTISYSI